MQVNGAEVIAVVDGYVASPGIRSSVPLSTADGFGNAFTIPTQTTITGTLAKTNANDTLAAGYDHRCWNARQNERE